MLVLDAGARVTQLRFLPDGRLLVGTWAAGDAEVAIWSLPSGPRIVIPLSVRQVWDEPNRVAVAPAGDRFYTTFGTLRAHAAADGRELPDGPAGPASRVIASPDGRRLVVAYPAGGGGPDGGTAVYGLDGGTQAWHTEHERGLVLHPAGFLPDGEQFVLVGGNRVRVRRFAGQDEVAVARYPTYNVYHPQLSPNGRHLGVIGYSSFYLYAAAAPGQPRQIKSSATFGNFVGFAFHPAGRTLAVIHGGPTLVKLYDLDTLTLRTKLNWKVGPLTCVAYSADGLLGAVGTDDGRVVVWDVDE